MEYKFIKIGNYKVIFNKYNENDLIIKGNFDKLINSDLNNDVNYEIISKLINNYTNQPVIKITKITKDKYIINNNVENVINLQNWFKFKEITNNVNFIQQMRIPEKINFNKCEICGNTSNLEAHHNIKRFSQIAKEFIVEYNIKNINEFKEYINEFKQYHSKEKHIITLCRKCHENLHKYDKCYAKNMNESNEWIDYINSN